MLKIERIYTKPFDMKGYRILVDRKWARGISKQAAQLDDWAKIIAPSNELREWFQHVDARYPEFEEHYFKELSQNSMMPDFLALIKQHLNDENVILLYGAKNVKHNNAVALQKYLIDKLNLKECDLSLIDYMYNDGATNRDKELPQLVKLIRDHNIDLDQFGLKIDNNKFYYGNIKKALDHYQLMKILK